MGHEMSGLLSWKHSWKIFLGWKFDGISFDYTKKTHESCFPKKTPKAVNGPCCILLCENLQRYGMLEVQVDMILHFFVHLLAFTSGWFKHVQALPLNWWFLFVLHSKTKQTSHFRGSKFECVHMTKWNSKHSCRRSFCLHVWDRTCAAICRHPIAQYSQ